MELLEKHKALTSLLEINIYKQIFMVIVNYYDILALCDNAATSIYFSVWKIINILSSNSRYEN